MLTTLAETYIIATRMDAMNERRHPDSVRIALMAAENRAKREQAEEKVRVALRRQRREGVRRAAARALTGAGAILSRLGNRIGPREACCP